MWPLVAPGIISISIFVLINSFMIGVTAKIMQIMLNDDDYMPGIVFAQLVWPVTLFILLGILLIKSIAWVPEAVGKLVQKVKADMAAAQKKKEEERRRRAETPSELNLIV
jgi:hypothetical protein